MIRQGYRAPAQRVLLFVGFAVVLTMGALSLFLIRQSLSATSGVDHSLTVLNVIANLRADVRRAESGQRGYLLTGDVAYLNDYNGTLGRVGPALAQLSELTADNPSQKALIDRLRPLIEEKLGELAATVNLTVQGRKEEALATVKTDRGLTLMQDIGNVYRDASAEERRLLDQRRSAGTRFEIALIVVNSAGVLAIGGLAYASYLLFRRSTRAIIEREQALKELNESLESRVQERTAELEAANQEVQRFAYVVTHDLRSPLVNIMGFTSELEVLRDSVFRRLEPPEEGPSDFTEAPAAQEEVDTATLRKDFDEAIHFIKTSIAKMDGLIKAILTLSRAGRRELAIQRVDLNEVLKGIAADVEHRVRESEAELIVGKMPVIRSDRMAVEQILSNLVDNALKYLRDGVPGRIEVRAEDMPREYRIHVIDNGRGIAPADRERVFDLFRRAAQDKPGEGIGLTHSRGLARRIGGTIQLDDAPGGGSVFTLVLSKLWMARQVATPEGAGL